MNWGGVAAGVSGFQSGFNWSQQAQARREELRKANEQRREDEITAQVGQEMANGQAVVPPSTGDVQGPGGPAPATTVAAPQQAQPSALAGGAAPTAAPAGDDDHAYQVQQQDVEAYQRLVGSGRSATGGPALNHDVLHDAATGRGMMPPATAVAAMRAASGNQNGPLTRTDYAAWVDAVSNRLMKEGLGHRVPEMRGRMMQTLHSAAARTMAVASAMADSGDLEGAARTMATAYGMMPDGQTLSFQRGQDGTTVATRVDAQGRAIGQPFPVTPDAIREMALRAQDPMEYAKLLLDRGKLDEVGRHNRAVEGLQGQELALRARALSMRGAGGGRGGGGGGGAARETSLTTAEWGRTAGEIDTQLEGYEQEAARRPRGSPDARPPEQVRGLAYALGQQGTPPTDAARIAKAWGMGTARPMVSSAGGVGIDVGGRAVRLSGPAAALVQSTIKPPAGGATPPAPPQAANPEYSGRYRLRE